MPKTNATRLLDQLGVAYERREYEVDLEDLSAKIGLPPEQVFKTLVAAGDRNGVCMAVIPADGQLDLKKLAVATGDRKVETVAVKDLVALEGVCAGRGDGAGVKEDVSGFC